jgi:hypothetical protein
LKILEQKLSLIYELQIEIELFCLELQRHFIELQKSDKRFTSQNMKIDEILMMNY